MGRSIIEESGMALHCLCPDIEIGQYLLSFVRLSFGESRRTFKT